MMARAAFHVYSPPVPVDADNPPPPKQSSTGLLLVCVVLLGAFGAGYAIAGPGTGYRLLGGGLAVVGVVALVAAILAILYAWLKVRCMRKEAAAKPYLDQLDAMSDDELRESTLAAIRETGYFQTVPASAKSTVDPNWPRDVREVFERFDRLSFTFTGEQRPYFTLDRSEVALMPQYTGALKVGTTFAPRCSVVVHLPTGRSVMSYGSANHEEIERSAKWPASSHRSLWHFIASHAVRHRVGLLAKEPPQGDPRG